VYNSLHDRSQSSLVSLRLWRVSLVTLALVVVVGSTAALWLGAQSVVKGVPVSARELSAWTFGPGAVGGESGGRITLRAIGQAERAAYVLGGQRLADFAFEARAMPLTGPDDSGYGLVTRCEGPDDFVALLIGPDGYIAVGQMSGGIWRWRVPWRQWPHIQRGYRENLVRAECRADRCRFWVNDEFAFEVEGIPDAGQVGFAVWNPDGSDVSATFSQWKMWK
jgi:hypothetical protein